jgi:dolichol-phosphate mannosyltransferase
MTVLVVMPTYNERPNIERVAERILRHDWARLLVVDDASPDGTADAAAALGERYPGRVDVLRRQGPRGLGLAYVDGLRRALQSGAEARDRADVAVREGAERIGQMDADLSHNPDHLPALRDALARHDLVIGSRYVPGGGVVNWPVHRIALSAFANRYIRAITGLGARDCTSGYRLWRREALARLPLANARANGYAFLTEMLYAAARQGCRIGEVPIIFVEREEGYSKVSGRVLFESLMTPWRLTIRGGRVRKPPAA